MCNVCCAQAGMEGIAHYDWEAGPEARKKRQGLMNNNDGGARTKRVLVQIEAEGAEFEPGRGRFRREDERDWSPWFEFHDAPAFCGWLCLDVRAAFVKRAIWRWITGKQGRENVEALIRRKIEDRKKWDDVDVWPRLKRAECEPEPETDMAEVEEKLFGVPVSQIRPAGVSLRYRSPPRRMTKARRWRRDWTGPFRRAPSGIATRGMIALAPDGRYRLSRKLYGDDKRRSRREQRADRLLVPARIKRLAAAMRRRSLAQAANEATP